MIDGGDVLGVVGLAMLGVGLWLWWPAASLMVCGGILLCVALASAVVRGLRGPGEG